MKSTDVFPFEKAKRVSPLDVEKGRRAIEKLTGKPRLKRKGRPPKAGSEKYVPVSIRLHPLALAWLKDQAKKKSVPYQTIINELLLKKAA
jgi:hypothetical protein